MAGGGRRLRRAVLWAAAAVLAGLWLWQNGGAPMPGGPDGLAPPSARQAVAARPAPQPPLAGAIDRILIEKRARRLTVFRDGRALRSYAVALGFAPAGAKAVQGDGRTPEGLFRIDRRNAASRYHLSLGIDYPRPADRARAAVLGRAPGGDIFIHGQPNRLPADQMLPFDWTAGCIALSNAEIEELWHITPTGTAVEIRP